MNELRLQADKEFENNLPMGRAIFKELFDYLDVQLGEKDCDNSLAMTQQFLTTQKVDNIERVIEWIQENGAGCGCEVLANVEDSFDS